MKQSSSAVRRAALLGGWRSGLEAQIGKQLETLDPTAQYEPCRLQYTRPEEKATYTPDWILGNFIVIESKGIFTSADRKKHRLIQQQHPGLDVRFVFSNSRARIGKKSSTTYAMWCQKYGFRYADKFIPPEWAAEKPNLLSLRTLGEIQK